MRARQWTIASVLLAVTLVAPAATQDDVLWEKLRVGGLVVLMRHAQTTPGAGDPAGFRIDDCKTQRNLSEQGREQARRLGEALRAQRIPIGDVLTSRWCRAVETAKLAFDRGEVWPPLGSTYDDEANRAKQKEAVRERISGYRGSTNLFLVGHGTNIHALTGLHPSMGGIVVVAPGGPQGFRIVGQLEPDAILRAPSHR